MRSMPEFMESEYYDVSKCCMKEEAPKSLKDAFEEYKNLYAYPDDEDYPDFSFPYEKWNGEVIDIGFNSDKAKEIRKKRAEYYGKDGSDLVE